MDVKCTVCGKDPEKVRVRRNPRCICRSCAKIKDKARRDARRLLLKSKSTPIKSI